jgi:type IV secretion system protein VirB4
MLTWAQLRDTYQQTGAFNGLVNLHGFLDNTTFLTKTGDVGVVLAVHGVDDECLDADARNHVARQFEAAARLFDDHTRILHYLLKRREVPGTDAAQPKDGVGRLLARRQQFLRDARPALYTVAIYWIILASPTHAVAGWPARARRTLGDPVGSVRAWLSPGQTVRQLDAELEQIRQRLHDQMRACVVHLEDTVRPRVLSKREAFRVFRQLLNYDPEKADAIDLGQDTFLDYHVCDSTLECHRGYLRLDDFCVRVLTLKALPAQTSAHVLRALTDVPSGLILMSEWQRADVTRIRRAIHARRRHFHQTRVRLTSYLGDEPITPGDLLVDDSATAVVRDLGACLTDLTLHGRYVGSFTLTVVVYDRDRAALARSVAACVKACGAQDAQLTDERPNLLNAWLAVLPGNAAYNLRAMDVLNTTYADLALLFAPDRGASRNPHLGREALTVLETTQRTPYHLNLHVQDVGHTLVLGATGSGKSFLLNFLLAQSQRYSPRTTVFDLGGSYERVTRYFGGSVLRVARDRGRFTINPFCLPLSADNRQFLWAFVKVLIQSGGQYTMTEADDRDLYEQLGTVYALEPDQRRLFTLATILRPPLTQHLQRWIQGGQYADLFDHVEDTITLARFQYIDFEGLEAVPQVLEPLLFYLLHRVDAAIADPAEADTLKVFVVDEAWRFLRDATIRAYLTAALKTWRKRNACVLLATQSSDDLVRSDLVRVAIESCPTTIFLANPQIDRAVYQSLFHLSETEAERIATLVPRQDLLVKRPEVTKVLRLHVDPESAALFGTSARGGGDRPVESSVLVTGPATSVAVEGACA